MERCTFNSNLECKGGNFLILRPIACFTCENCPVEYEIPSGARELYAKAGKVDPKTTSTKISKQRIGYEFDDGTEIRKSVTVYRDPYTNETVTVFWSEHRK